MNRYLFLILGIFLFSCHENRETTPNSFKNGTFKTVLEDNETISTAIRNDTIQIETYNNIKDTFSILWVDNFEYILVKKNPKSMLDSTPFHVKITRVKKNSYEFKAFYKGSNFKQKGTAYKLE